MTPETFQISIEKQFKLKAIATEIAAAKTEAIKEALFNQMQILISQDNAIRLLMKGDLTGDPFDFSLCQKLEVRKMEMALPNMSRDQAIATFTQAINLSAVKSNLIKHFGDKLEQKK